MTQSELHALNVAAMTFVNSMIPRADVPYPFPSWHGWALRDAFLAGFKLGIKKRRKPAKKKK